MLRRLRNRILLKLGTEGFSKNLLNFSVVQIFFIFATTLSDVFISVFLFKSGGQDFSLVAKYNLFKYFLEGTGFTLALYASKWRNVLFSMKLGILFYIGAYIALLILQGNARYYYVLIALLVGFGSGCYWMGYHTLTHRYTTAQNRQAAFGFISLTSNAIATIAPPVSGLITHRFTGIRGYIIIFAVTLTMFILTALYSQKLTYHQDEKIEPHLFKLLGQLIRYSGTRNVVTGEILRGFRDGVVLYYLNVLVYYASSSELYVGICLALKNLLMIWAYAYVKRLRSAKLRCRAAIISGSGEILFLCAMLATGLFGGRISSVLIMIYSVIYILFYVLAYNHGQLAVYDTMEWAGRIRNTDYEMVTIRHYFAETGRIFVMLILIALPTDPIYGVMLLIIGGVSTILSAFAYRRGSEKIQHNLFPEGI